MFAGIPECNGIRLEDVASCDVRADAECMASCDRLGIYEVACATRLETVCRDRCVLDPMPTCTDSCTVMCTAECDAGVSITCQHNCYGECAGVCADRCAADDSSCLAQCRATCDGACDVQCASVDGDCYVHCVECCDGSCTAQANMDCQFSCQEEMFEDCEYEFQADCTGSCSVDGALFCDDEYVMNFAEATACVDALLERGVTVRAEGSVTIGPGGVGTSGSAGACSVQRVGIRSARGATNLFALVFLGVSVVAFGFRRRR